MKPRRPAPERLLSTGEVALLFQVIPKTVTRWEERGLLTSVTRTLGGHRRFREAEVRELLARATTDRSPGYPVIPQEDQ